VRGDQFFENGQYAQAVEAYSEYLKLYPSNLKTIYNRGRALEELQDFKSAKADFDRVLKIDPTNVKALLSIGKHYYRLEDYEEAVFYFEKALSGDKGNPQGLFMKARANHKMGNVQLALIDYNHAINLKSDYGEAYLYRGAVKEYMKSKKGACKDFQAAFDLEVPEAKEALARYCR